jgi:RNA-directed DNA polymerase
MAWWTASLLNDVARKLFKNICNRKRCSGHNHDIHFLAREIDDWLPKGILSLLDGSYTPRFLKRVYLPDEVIDQMHLSDRILQHLLLRMIKPTLKYVINSNCHHIAGPSGVKRATTQIQQALKNNKPNYFIRADIKSYYKSIVHYKLIIDVKKYYHDTKLIKMLANIIENPIDGPCGFLNPYTGIALRGPLSQFFSGLYLKPLDDAMQKMDVTYLRYQDDILILCKTKRQRNRCKRKMMAVLQERHLRLSRRKTRMGEIESGFHFLGITYPPTQKEDNTNTTCLSSRIIPHPRTLRKARENVKQMVKDGVSRPKIRSYLFRWLCWWATTSSIWERSTLNKWFIEACRDETALQIAFDVNQYYFKELWPNVGAAATVAA